MSRNYFLLLIIVIVQISCSTKTNQYLKTKGLQQQRHGKWVEKDNIGEDQYLMKGKYRNGEKIGLWKTYLNGKIYQKDRIKDSITFTKIYFPNGKTEVKGQSKLTINDDYRHWRYVGDWKYFDAAGKLLYVKKHQSNGKVDSISFVK